MVERHQADGEEPAVTLDAFLEQSNATAIRLEPDEDARALIPFLDRLALIEVAFPTFRDGRGYSAARILREAGFAGELRAAGDIGIDQLVFLKRCGFDSFAPDAPLDPVAAERAFNTWPHAYQGDAAGAVPVWKLRHGG